MKYFVAISVVSLASLLTVIPKKVTGHEYNPSFEKEGTRSNFAVPTAAAPSHYWPAPGGRPQYYGPQRPAVPPYWSGKPDPPQPYPHPVNIIGPDSPEVFGNKYGYRYRTDKDGKLVLEPFGLPYHFGHPVPRQPFHFDDRLPRTQAVLKPNGPQY